MSTETDDPMARTLEVLAELTIQAWLAGPGHRRPYLRIGELSAKTMPIKVIGRLREAGVNMIANPATNLMLQGPSGRLS